MATKLLTDEATTAATAGAVPKLNASGRVSTAQLGSGTANSSTFLRGDQTWAATGGGGAPADAPFICWQASADLTNEFILGTNVIMKGTLAARPAPSVAGKLYYVTDAGSARMTRDTGSAWEDLLPDWTQVVNKPSTFTPATHQHPASDINSGTMATARLGSGTANSTTYLRGDQTWAVPSGSGGAPVDGPYICWQASADLTNEFILGTNVIMKGTLAARPAAAAAGRLYYVTDSGSARFTRDTGSAWEDLPPDWTQVVNKPSTFPPATHTHPASDIASGTVATARLGSGTANSTTFLRGDQTWATPSGGGSAPTVEEVDGSPAIASVSSIQFQEPRFTITNPSGSIARVTYTEPLSLLVMSDDFMPGSTEAGEIGDLAWSFSAGSVAFASASALHPGILTLSSAASAGSICRAFLGTTGSSAVIVATDVSRIIGIVRPVQNTNARFRFGLTNNAGTQGAGTDNVMFHFHDGTSANWQCTTTSGGTGTTVTSSVAVTAGNWYQLEARRQSGGNWEFYINDSLVTTSSTNLPTVGVGPFYAAEASSASAVSLDVDFFYLRSVIMGQRWT